MVAAEICRNFVCSVRPGAAHAAGCWRVEAAMCYVVAVVRAMEWLLAPSMCAPCTCMHVLLTEGRAREGID